MFPAEYNIPSAHEAGNHPFFEEFPFLLSAYTRQIVWWADRELILQHNRVSGSEFVLEFMREEYVELEGAVESGVVQDIQDEAADVGVVSFAAPAFLGIEEWRGVSDEVLKMVSRVIKMSGLSEEEYARHVEEVITGKNKLNHPAIVYQGLPIDVDDEGVGVVYRASREGIRNVRYKHPDKRLPIEVNTVLRLNGRTAETKYGDDPFYQMALEAYGKMLEVREGVVDKI